MVGQLGLGYLAGATSLAAGYVLGGVVTLLGLPLVALARSAGRSADRIVGEAGKRSACAPAGLPEVAALDATDRT